MLGFRLKETNTKNKNKKIIIIMGGVLKSSGRED